MTDRRNRQVQDYTDRVAGDYESRISRDDEQQMTDAIRRGERAELRTALVEAFEEIERRLDFIDSNAAKVTAGDHRDQLKAIRRTVRAARRAIS